MPGVVASLEPSRGGGEGGRRGEGGGRREEGEGEFITTAIKASYTLALLRTLISTGIEATERTSLRVWKQG